MIVNNDYPKIKKKVNKFLLIRKIILIVFLIAFITCLTVNLLTGGILWSMYVLFGELEINSGFADNAIIAKIKNPKAKTNIASERFVNPAIGSSSIDSLILRFFLSIKSLTFYLKIQVQLQLMFQLQLNQLHTIVF